MTRVRVADYIATRLREWGVESIFTLSGGGMMHLQDAVGRTPGLHFLCHHNEQCAAIAADAQARRSGRLAVCYATSGPGGTNLLTGIVGAWQDSSPVLYVTGQSKTTQTIQGSGIRGLRQFGTFEVDIVPIVASVTKYAVMVTDPRRVRYHLEKARHLATTGRPGPVLLDIPLDVQGAPIDPDTLDGFDPPAEDHAPALAAVEEVLAALRAARRPLLLAGIGVRAGGAVESFRSLVERLGVPVATTQFGKDVLPYDNPLFVGHPGPKGDRPGNFAIQAADLIVSLGCSLHAQTTGWENDLFAPHARKIQIDLDAAVLAREQVGVSLKIQAGVAEFVAALTPLVTEPLAVAPWVRRCQDWKRRYAIAEEPHERPADARNYYDVVEALNRAVPPDACVVTDAGSAFYTLGQGFRIQPAQRFISSGSLGAMGFALPAAVGAATTGTGVTVCVTGDGSLLTNVHDLAVMSHNRLDVKLIVVNNDGYVSIRNTQRDFCGGLYLGTDGTNGVFIPAMEDLARSYRLPFLRCDSGDDLDAVLARALATEGPVLVEVTTMRDQRIIPSVTSVRLPDGRMQSMQLHQMAPFLPEGVAERELAAAREEE